MRTHRTPARDAAVHAAADALSLADLRVGFGIGPRASAPEAAALAALVAFWEEQLESEAASASASAAASAGFGYDSAYDAPFAAAPADASVGVSVGAPIPFTALPIGLRALVGGPAVGSPDLARSRWTRHAMRVQDLAPVLLTSVAVRHVWPCSGPGCGTFGLPPYEYLGGYTRLLATGEFNAPVIFYGDGIHRHAVPYALALLRFAPTKTVWVLRGIPGDVATTSGSAANGDAVPPGPYVALAGAYQDRPRRVGSSAIDVIAATARIATRWGAAWLGGRGDASGRDAGGARVAAVAAARAERVARSPLRPYLPDLWA